MTETYSLTAEDIADETNWWKSSEEILDTLNGFLKDEDRAAIKDMKGYEAMHFLAKVALPRYPELGPQTPESFLKEKQLISY